MQLVRTSFNLRSDLRWAEDAYENGIFAWINGSKNPLIANFTRTIPCESFITTTAPSAKTLPSLR